MKKTMTSFPKKTAVRCTRRHRRRFECQYWMLQQPMTDLTTEKNSRKLLTKKIEVVVVVDHYYDGVFYSKKQWRRLPRQISRLHLPFEWGERQSVHLPLYLRENRTNWWDVLLDVTNQCIRWWESRKSPEKTTTEWITLVSITVTSRHKTSPHVTPTLIAVRESL